ncbi:MAG: haloacid dehalogenase-like hydrolase [bacterium]|nr:haloacid dehalogenase-like hydrolase [bacterium]
MITNKERFEELKKEFKKDGVEKLHVLADFDRTFTYAFVNGKKIPSLLSILRDEKYLTPDYSEKANALFDKYHAIEINPDFPLEEKKKVMKEWWTVHFELLIKSNLSKNDMVKAVESNNIVLRDGLVEFLNTLKNNNIPLVVLSSSGLGKEAIELCLEKKGLSLENIHIISNSFKWDENGKAISVKEPIIHTLNKDETAVKNFPEIFKKVKERKNMVLLGDSISDIEMATGFDYEKLIKIGFLNEEIEASLENYKKVFDVLILNDSSAKFLNQLLREII